MHKLKYYDSSSEDSFSDPTSEDHHKNRRNTKKYYTVKKDSNNRDEYVAESDTEVMKRNKNKITKTIKNPPSRRTHNLNQSDDNVKRSRDRPVSSTFTKAIHGTNSKYYNVIEYNNDNKKPVKSETMRVKSDREKSKSKNINNDHSTNNNNKLEINYKLFSENLKKLKYKNNNEDSPSSFSPNSERSSLDRNKTMRKKKLVKIPKKGGAKKLKKTNSSSKIIRLKKKPVPKKKEEDTERKKESDEEKKQEDNNDEEERESRVKKDEEEEENVDDDEEKQSLGSSSVVLNELLAIDIEKKKTNGESEMVSKLSTDIHINSQLDKDPLDDELYNYKGDRLFSDLELPDKIVLTILGYLDAKSLCRCSRVSSYFLDLSDNERIWKNLTQRTYDDIPNYVSTIKLTWKSTYQYLYQQKLRKENILLNDKNCLPEDIDVHSNFDHETELLNSLRQGFFYFFIFFFSEFKFFYYLFLSFYFFF